MTAMIKLNDQFLNSNVSQSRVVTRLRSGGIFSDLLVAYLVYRFCSHAIFLSFPVLYFPSLAGAVGPFYHYDYTNKYTNTYA